MLLPVILAGGSGTRLWPMSRKNYPKQFLTLHGDNSMLQNTLGRLNGMKHHTPMIICNTEHRFLAAEQLQEIADDNWDILLEPVGRNTAPAIAIAALSAIERSDDPILLVLPADHIIEDVESFQVAVKKAKEIAEQNKLVTFGIVPTKAETGYGYIKKGTELDTGFYNVDGFLEKPEEQLAQELFKSKEYLWNSGMFMFRASQYLKELEQFQPEVLEACRSSYENKKVDLDFIRIDEKSFERSTSISIDYAIMEKTSNSAVVPLEVGWNDVGGYDALWQCSEKNEHGNSIKGDVRTLDTKNSLVISEDKLVTTIGIDNMIIVDTKDSLLVAHKGKAQHVKKIVNQLSAESREEVNYHREVYRPWGKYDSVDSGSRFQVKRITVKPGAKLSVQMHHHRAEHWVVVSGTAKVVIDNVQSFLTENESIYIPVTAVHSLENPGNLPLELIEVQSGSYLGEDDIVRFDDQYGRVDK